MNHNDSLGVVAAWVQSVRKPPTCRNDMLGLLVPFWGVKTEGKPPMSHYDSLGMLVTLLWVEIEGKPPTSRNDLLGSLWPGSKV